MCNLEGPVPFTNLTESASELNEETGFGSEGPLRESPGPSELVLPHFHLPRSPLPATHKSALPHLMPFHSQLVSLETHCSPPHVAVPVSARQVGHIVWGFLIICQLSMDAVLAPFSVNSPQGWESEWALLFPGSHSPPLSQQEEGQCAKPGSNTHFGMEAHLLQTSHRFLWAVALTLDQNQLQSWLSSDFSTFLLFPNQDF